MNYYKQAELQKQGRSIIGWIDATKAIVGNICQVKNDDGSWDEGWTVINVWGIMDGKEVQDRSADWRKTRRASDV